MIGWDAADRETVETWLADGTLPTLRGLRDRGRSGRIAELPGLGDDAAWGSFATGVEPGVHGRFHHRQLVPGTYRTDNFFRGGMTGEAFWSRVSHAGRRVAVLDVPKSPLGAGPNGVQLADWLPHGEDGHTPVSSPAALAASLPERFRLPPGFSCHDTHTGVAELTTLRDRIRAHLDLRSELALTWLRQEPWDLFLTVFAESHCIGHHCWHLHDEAHPAHDGDARRVLGDPVREIHRALDDTLAGLLAASGPETTVIVFSLLGMGTCFVPPLTLVDEVLRRLDASRADDGSRARRWLDGLLARPNTSVAVRANAADRNAFAVHTDSVASAIRVNLAGRDPRGRVRPEALDEYCGSLAAGFADLVDPATGRRLVSEVVRVAERYRGPRAPFADLLVVWNAAAPINAVASAKIGVIDAVRTTYLAGNHRPGGWFVAAGPDIAPGVAAAPMAIVDFAPTVAALLGVDLSDCAGTARLASAADA